jgi:hypothetical protein
MDAVVERQSHIPFHSKPSVQEPAQIVRQFSVDDLTGLLRANENTISSLASERAIDPPTLRAQLLLHLPRFFATDGLPSERDIQRDILAVSDFVEDRQRSYARG